MIMVPLAACYQGGIYNKDNLTYVCCDLRIKPECGLRLESADLANIYSKNRYAEAIIVQNRMGLP